MKRKMAWILTIAMLSTCAVGCADKKETDEGSVDTLTYWAPMPGSSAMSMQNLGDLLVYQELEKRTGIHVDFINPPAGQEHEQFNLMLASGVDSLPDIIETTWFSYSGGPGKAIADNLIIPLNQYLDNEAANYGKILEENPLAKKQVTTDAGDVFAFAAISDAANRTFGGLILRQDWLDELNLPVPETRSEWETTLRAFRDQKGATAPFTVDINKFYTYHFNNIFDVGMTEYVDNGTYKIPEMQPEFKELISMFHSWYEEGLLDNEYDTNDGTIVDAKMTNGTSGATYGYIGGTMGRYATAMKEKDPAYKLTAAPFPKTENGGEPRFAEYTFDAIPPHLSVTTNCKHPEVAVKWADYFYSLDGAVLLGYGVEGLTYTVEDGKYVFTDLITKNPDGLSINEARGKYVRKTEPSPGLTVPESLTLPQYYDLPEQNDALVIWNSYVDNVKDTALPPLGLTIEESEEVADLTADLFTYKREMIVRFVKGLEPMEKYDEFVANFRKMGGDRVTEIYQAALDRYNER